MPIVSVADFKDKEDPDGPRGDEAKFMAEAMGDNRADGEKLPPYGPGGIYHEKQVGQLCAVHCLNNLLQGPNFNEVHLAEVAQQLDASERALLGGAAVQGGGNVRDDGFFNVEVIRACLQNAGFEVQLLNAATARALVAQPAKQRGFICNRKEHWFAMRRIANEWFDLNSCLRTPRHFTDAELSQHINEALAEGYSVFAVQGDYLKSALETDQKKLLEAVQGCGRSGQKHCLFAGEGQTLSGNAAPTGGGPSAVDPELLAAAEDDPELAAAIAASLQDAQLSAPAAAAPAAPESMDEIRRKRLARFG